MFVLGSIAKNLYYIVNFVSDFCNKLVPFALILASFRINHFVLL